MTPAGVEATNAASKPLPSARNIKIVLEYDGTDYHGFQSQSEAPTIQGELERALLKITGYPTRVAGAGRTDSGVHALGQVASFRARTALPVNVLLRALNAVLPADIAVIEASEVPEQFHARFSARSREYRYGILNRPVRAPLERRFLWHVPEPLDVQAMHAAAQEMVGEHDFASFAGAGETKGTSRSVLAAGCEGKHERIYVTVEANAFLPHMVRNIVGTLVIVGKGKLDAVGFRDVVAAKDRHKAGPTAPAHGLYLMRVNY